MPSAENDAGCCSHDWQTADCTSVSDANFCPLSILKLNDMLKNQTLMFDV